MTYATIAAILLFVTPASTATTAKTESSIITPTVYSGEKTLKAIPIADQGDNDYVGYVKNTEKQVRSYFAKTPIMAEIASCESSFRHLDKDGLILRGKVTTGDIGVMQINENVHAKTAEKLGIDLYTLEGNMKFAEWLYEQQGLKPWVSSSDCWKKYE